MISWTITVPPTIGPATFTESGSASENYEAVFGLVNGSEPEQIYSSSFSNSNSGQTLVLSNGDTVIDREEQSQFYAATFFYISEGEAPENDTQQGNTNTIYELTYSWNGNTLGLSEAPSQEIITIEAQTTRADVSTYSYGVNVTTTQSAITGDTSLVSSQTVATTASTIVTNSTTQSILVNQATTVTTTTSHEVTAYNGNTGNRHTATQIIAEGNERIFVPNAPPTSGMAASYGLLGDFADETLNVVYPQIITWAPVTPQNELTSSQSTQTAQVSSANSYVLTKSIQAVTNSSVYPSPSVSVGISDLAVSNAPAQQVTQTAYDYGNYYTTTAVATTQTYVGQLVDGKWFDRTAWTTSERTLTLPVGATYSDSYATENIDTVAAVYGTAGEQEFGAGANASGFTTTPWSYWQLYQMGNHAPTSYAKSYVYGRGNPSDLSEYGTQLSAQGMTLTAPFTAKAAQTAVLPFPMTSWSFTQSNVSVLVSADAAGVTQTSQFSNGSATSQSGAWALEGTANTSMSPYGKTAVALNAGGEAATGQATLVYGPGAALTTNSDGVSGVELGGVRSALFDSTKERTAISTALQYVAAPSYSQGEGMFFVTTTRNPLGHIADTQGTL
jgi:hypothetical protein